jgi:hypothetical protein
MVIFSFLCWWAYPASEYSSSQEPPKNFFAAIVDSMNPSDLIFGILRIFTVATAVRGGGRRRDPEAQSEASYALVEGQQFNDGRYAPPAYPERDPSYEDRRKMGAL